jgi:hypothetical protein
MLLRIIRNNWTVKSFLSTRRAAGFEDQEDDDEDEYEAPHEGPLGGEHFQQKSDRISKIATARSGVYCSYLT